MNLLTLEELHNYIWDIDLSEMDEDIDEKPQRLFGVSYSTIYEQYVELSDAHRGSDWNLVQTMITRKEVDNV